MSLSSHKVRTSVAVSDLAEARRFYERMLGLTPGEDQPDESLVYPCRADSSLHVCVSPAHVGQSAATVATWHVTDLERVVDELGIHELEGGRVAWFNDPDGNTSAVEQAT